MVGYFNQQGPFHGQIKMKKNLIVFSSILLLLPVIVLAAGPGQPSGNIQEVGDLYDNITAAVWQVFVIIGVVMIVVSGILFLTAQGEPDKLKKAKDSFIWGVAGIVVAILAYSIITIATNLIETGGGA